MFISPDVENGLVGYSEPLRRFIQHEGFSPQVNEIANQMPSWIPGEDHLINFQKGDPYIKIDEGYARLPGAGYEALHPELEGIDPEDYPDINKLSILGDVAPTLVSTTGSGPSSRSSRMGTRNCVPATSRSWSRSARPRSPRCRWTSVASMLRWIIWRERSGVHRFVGSWPGRRLISSIPGPSPRCIHKISPRARAQDFALTPS
jgi:hypothetical protein